MITYLILQSAISPLLAPTPLPNTCVFNTTSPRPLQDVAVPASANEEPKTNRRPHNHKKTDRRPNPVVLELHPRLLQRQEHQCYPTAVSPHSNSSLVLTRARASRQVGLRTDILNAHQALSSRLVPTGSTVMTLLLGTKIKNTPLLTRTIQDTHLRHLTCCLCT